MKKVTQKTILLVEDEVLIAMTEKLVLEKHGYSVITATSGEKAIDVVSQPDRIDLVLMDINLGGGMDGTQAAEIILRGHDLPLVFLSSHTEPAVVQKTEAITSYGYIVKNSGETVLLASIKMAFRLFESKKLAGNTFEYSINGLCIHRMLYDAAGVPYDCEYLRVNAAYEKQTGITGQFLTGKTIRDLFPDAEAAEVIALYGHTLATGTPARHELFFNPLQAWFELSVFPTTDDEFAVVVHNITERKLAERALKEERARLSRITETSPVGIVEVDEAGTIVYANSTAERILGLTRDEITERTYNAPQWKETDLDGTPLPEDKLPFSIVRVTGKPAYDVRHGIERPDGRHVQLSVNGSPILDADGHFRGMVATIEDITERLQAERVHRESEHRLQSIFRAAAIGIGVVQERNIVEVNPGMCKMTGYAADELIGRNARMLYPALEEYDRVGVDKYRQIEERGTGAVETRWRRKDGSIIEILLSSTPLDPANLAEGTTFTALDITDRKQKKPALHATSIEVQNLRTFEGVGSWVWNIAENTVEWSDQMYRIFGIDKKRFTGDLAAVIESSIHPDDREKVERSNASVVQAKAPIPVEYRVIRPDDTVRTVWAEAGELELDSAGSPRVLRGIVHDITERKQMEEKLTALLAEKDTLLKETYHRIKNNFSVVESLLAVQMGLAVTAETAAALSHVQSRVTSIRALYEELLRSDQHDEVAAGEYLSRLGRTILQAHGAAGRIELRTEIEAVRLNTTNVFPIGAIVAELTTNSLKYAYAPQESGTITLRIVSDGETGVLTLSDSGRGTAQDLNAESETSFGLMLVRMMAEQIGGTLEIQSVPGQGVQAMVRFPLGT